MLPLPLHFPVSVCIIYTNIKIFYLHIYFYNAITLNLLLQNLIIKDLLSGVGDKHNPLLFGQLKCRVMNLLINALQVETDAHNTHLLLGICFVFNSKVI